MCGNSSITLLSIISRGGQVMEILNNTCHVRDRHNNPISCFTSHDYFPHRLGSEEDEWKTY